MTPVYNCRVLRAAYLFPQSAPELFCHFGELASHIDDFGKERSTRLADVWAF
jgi:hypothetical protein